jgi:hypothetical protein
MTRPDPLLLARKDRDTLFDPRFLNVTLARGEINILQICNRDPPRGRSDSLVDGKLHRGDEFGAGIGRGVRGSTEVAGAAGGGF